MGYLINNLKFCGQEAEPGLRYDSCPAPDECGFAKGCADAFWAEASVNVSVNCVYLWFAPLPHPFLFLPLLRILLLLLHLIPVNVICVIIILLLPHPRMDPSESFKQLI